MYEDLFPIEERPQPLLDPDSGDILGKCYNCAPEDGEREQRIRRNRRLRYQRIGTDAERVLTRLIPLADGMERILEIGGKSAEVRESPVLQNWLKTIEGLYRRLRGIMEREGMLAVNSVGKPLDLDLHEVVEARGGPEGGNEVVVEERTKAYLYDNRVIRDAQVIVERVPDVGRTDQAAPREETKEE